MYNHNPTMQTPEIQPPSPFPPFPPPSPLLLEQRELAHGPLRAPHLLPKDLLMPLTPHLHNTFKLPRPDIKALGVIKDVVISVGKRQYIESPDELREGDVEGVAGEIGAGADAAAPAKARMPQFTRMCPPLLHIRALLVVRG